MIAKKRNGETIEVGDEVTTNWTSHCEGKVFVVEKITSHFNLCESGHLVLVHLKEDVERKLKGFTGNGIDTNHFTKVK